jgi:hypothetical protein
MDPRDYDTGLFLQDLLTSADFLSRPERPRSMPDQMVSLQRLARVISDTPDSVLQELAEAALELCRADTAGVSIETIDAAGKPIFHWVAIAGAYAPFRHATMPVHIMPCSVALREQRPQLVRAPSLHFKKLMNLDVAPITDGILLPWNADGNRATLWAVAHERTHAFDRTDYQILQIFADFAANAYRVSQQHRRNLIEATANGASAMAHTLAGRLNIPLQSGSRGVYGLTTDEAETEQLTDEVSRLARLVQELLAVYRPGRLQ